MEPAPKELSGPPSQDAANLSDLMALVSHEFNNYLNGIFLRLALLEQEFPAARGELKLIRKLGDEAAGLIRRVQQVNRPVHAAPQPVDVNEVIKESANGVQHLSPPPRIELDLAADSPKALVPAPDFRRLVSLLLGHCASVIAPQDGKITVQSALAGSKVEIEVRDTGPPIPDELLPHAFDPFIAAREGANETSLGICKMLVRRLRGDIRATNLPQGVAFHIELRACR